MHCFNNAESIFNLFLAGFFPQISHSPCRFDPTIVNNQHHESSRTCHLSWTFLHAEGKFSKPTKYGVVLEVDHMHAPKVYILSCRIFSDHLTMSFIASFQVRAIPTRCCHPAEWRRQRCQMLKARISHHSRIHYAHTQPSNTSIGKGRPIHLSIHLWCLLIHYERGWSGCTRSNYSFVDISLNYIII